MKDQINRFKSERKIAFIVGVTTVSILAVAAFFFAASYVVRYFQDYLKYARLKETGVTLEKDGLDGILSWISEREEVPSNLNVSYFEADLRKNGMVYGFTLSLEEYDDENKYVRDVRYFYDSETGELSTSEDVITYLAIQYDPNAEWQYLDNQFKRIPFTAQMRELDFDRYTAEFSKNRRVQAQTAVIDGRDGAGFPVLTWEEYQQGAGGSSDGSSQVVISLTDGTGALGQRIEYICFAADTEALIGNPEGVMQVDYKIDQDLLMLTDDHGETWIPSGLTEAEVQETLATYNMGQEIPENSFCADGSGTFALFYGKNPVLRVIEDDGKNWADIAFDEEFPRACVKRVVQFLDHDNWYAALGTDWSMGTGGATFVYWTHDRGVTWTKYSVPDTNALMLTGLAFLDTQNGILTMEGAAGGDTWPQVYVTADGGAHFTQIEPDWESVEDAAFLNKVDSLTYENGVYTIIMGQGEYGNKKVRFTAETLGGPWTFEESYIGTVHTRG